MDDRLMYRKTFYIDGEWVPGAGPDYLEIVSPSTEEIVGGVPVAIGQDIDRAVTAARKAFEGPWSAMPGAERCEILMAAAGEFRKRQPDLVGTQVAEMGIPVSGAGGQCSSVPPVLEYYADLARTYAFEREEVVGSAAATVVQDPVGVVGAITPWNGPTVLSTWKIAPALAAGCTVVLKPPPESPLSQLVLAEVFEAAGVPAGVLNVVPGGREAGEHLVRHRGTDKIAFTGSTAAGKRIMSACSDQVKRVSLELGGKSAMIICPDIDFATIIPAFTRGAMRNSGQVCAMPSRALVHRSRYDEAVELAAATAAELRIGDPHDPDTEIGPLVAKRQQDRVLGYVQIAIDEGARVVTGGKRPAGMRKGWYVEPTVLANVDNNMRVAQEEIFGPVVSFIPFDDDDHAVAIANDSVYGLGGGVWSADIDHAKAIARRLRTGTINVNGGAPPHPRVPYGGFKESGLGRELGVEGLEMYLEPKTIAYPSA
jgi:aldehyde dehydrogenase (NAD+)